MDWILIKGWNGKPSGAVGFIGNDAVMVIAFYDDRDGNADGEVSMGERIASAISPISIKNKAVTEVAMSARYNMDVLQRDASFQQMATKLYLNFARGLVLDGIYTVYFSRGVRMTGAGLAKRVTSDAIKGFVIRKGFEKAVKESFKAATNR